MKPSLSKLGKFDYLGLLLLRLGAGALFAYRGFPLFLEGPKTWRETGEALELLGIDSLHLIAGLAGLMIQAFGGVAIVLGLFTRGFALALAVVASLGLGVQLDQGAEELRLLVIAHVSLSCLCLAFVGPGRLSIDRRGV